ncbi:MAG: dihydropteroate synthase [Myxococcota bacterium]|nr:dihydropteroate synthase [Myxococcota bacterium]
MRNTTVRWSESHWQSSLSAAPLVMGIINATPDSFSDGGRFQTVKAALSRVSDMVGQGADIIDVGGESTRPGAKPVPVDEELKRVIPIISEIKKRHDVLVSIDTMKAAVAEAAIRSGVDIINDVSALTADPAMEDVACASDVGLILMHMRGRPETMQLGDLSSVDVVDDVCQYLQARIDALVSKGIMRERIAVDPGIGFGKTVEQNLALINRLDELAVLNAPVLLGVSRKSVLGAITERPVDQREAAGCAAHTVGLLKGARIIRVHEVAVARDVVRMTSALVTGGA